MPYFPRRAATFVPVLAVSAMLLGAVAAVEPAVAETANAQTGPTAPCASQLLPEPAPAADAIDDLTTGEKKTAAAINETTVSELVGEAKADESLWLDECGKALYVDAAEPGAQLVSAPATKPAPFPLEQTFALASRPGSKRTLYLDFDGATITGTAWNTALGQSSFTVPAYTIDTDAAHFSTSELTQIQRAWAIVAEDYAPFDVNVTTARPAPDAIDRSSSLDQTYGNAVVITAGGPVYEAQGRPGGISYVDTFDYSGGQGHAYYQPSWVFTDGTGDTDGKYFGEAAAHEAGHSFGLSHDGKGTSDYYEGDGAWAPIMGAGYYSPVTQWSVGDYTGATNREDDTAIIARSAPYAADDHGDSASQATVLADGESRTGIIGRRTDKDAFTFGAAGSTTVTVTPTAVQPDLDVSLTILDGSGQTVATVNPAVKVNYAGAAAPADGLAASATFTAPEGEGALYTAVVDGAGYGSPANPGQYSDYGSLGAYRITLATNGGPTPVRPASSSQTPATSTTTATGSGTPTLAPLAFTRTRLGAARADRRYRAALRVATGGVTVQWARRGKLPKGIRLTPGEHGSVLRLVGKPRKAGRYRFVLTGHDSHGRQLSRRFTLVVRR